jgi:hypothetical protein
VIAADASTWIAFLQGSAGKDTQLLIKVPEDPPVMMNLPQH